MTQMRRICTDCRVCRVHQLSVSIGIIRVICAQFFMFVLIISVKFITFVSMNSVTTCGGARKDFIEKGVIEIIFLDNMRNRFPHLCFIPVRMPNVGSREAKKEYTEMKIFRLFMMLMFLGLGIAGYGSIYEAIGIGVVLLVIFTIISPNLWKHLLCQIFLPSHNAINVCPISAARTPSRKSWLGRGFMHVDSVSFCIIRNCREVRMWYFLNMAWQ